MSDLTTLHLEGHVKAAKAKKTPKTAPKSKIVSGVPIKSVTTLDAGNGLLVEVIETANPVAKKPPVPKKKPSEPEQIEAPKEPAQAPKLRGPQQRILAFLAKQKKPVTRKQIAEGAPVDTAMATEYLGSANDAIRLKNDALRFPSLISLGLISATPADDDKPVTTYTITDAGKEALKATK